MAPSPLRPSPMAGSRTGSTARVAIRRPGTAGESIRDRDRAATHGEADDSGGAWRAGQANGFGSAPGRLASSSRAWAAALCSTSTS